MQIAIITLLATLATSLPAPDAGHVHVPTVIPAIQNQQPIAQNAYQSYAPQIVPPQGIETSESKKKICAKKLPGKGYGKGLVPEKATAIDPLKTDLKPVVPIITAEPPKYATKPIDIAPVDPVGDDDETPSTDEPIVPPQGISTQPPATVDTPAYVPSKSDPIIPVVVESPKNAIATPTVVVPCTLKAIASATPTPVSVLPIAAKDQQGPDYNAYAPIPKAGNVIATPSSIPVSNNYSAGPKVAAAKSEVAYDAKVYSSGSASLISSIASVVFVAALMML